MRTKLIVQSLAVGILTLIQSSESFAGPFSRDRDWCKAYKNPCNGAPGKCTKNSDGSLGGFVADTAFVEESVAPRFFGKNRVRNVPYISITAEVCEQARVEGNYARLEDFVTIAGTAIVQGVVEKNARVLGQTKVSVGEFVSKNSLLERDDQIRTDRTQKTRVDFVLPKPKPSTPREVRKAPPVTRTSARKNDETSDDLIWTTTTLMNSQYSDYSEHSRCHHQPRHHQNQDQDPYGSNSGNPGYGSGYTDLSHHPHQTHSPMSHTVDSGWSSAPVFDSGHHSHPSGFDTSTWSSGFDSSHHH